ncbi:aromatic acid exporter family protein [Psychromicrobium sp. YIM B11713]|uniref:FUSC family protein n=1 Tax=Psychromicrobium sp. YIM B11713 TaxID=3145233 RepID=UPI00374F4233
MPVSRRPIPSTTRFLRAHASTGFRRSGNSVVPAIQMTICAVAAYAFAEYVLGHSGPIFAATSSLIALGFSRDPRLRRVLEVAIGCTLGIIMGELVLGWAGPGIWQAAVVLFLSIMLARFLDGGVIFATQLGLQSVLVILLPLPTGGPFSRSLDAVVGGCFALIITLLTPRDPRKEPQQDVRKLLTELSEILRGCAEALLASDSTVAWHALVRARSAQPLIDQMRVTLRSSGEMTNISPAYRRYRGEIISLQDSLEHLDYAMRNARVFTRRLTSAINNAALSDSAVQGIAQLLEDSANAVDLLALGLSERDATASAVNLHYARAELVAIAEALHPKLLGIQRLEGETVVMLFRPLLVDLLEAAGMETEEAKHALPKV